MQTIDLRGSWTLTRVSTGDSYQAAVPGDNISALLAAGAIPDPYYAKNELDLQWIGREDWRFDREFEVDARLIEDPAARKGLFLHFDGIDTVAEIELNGKRIGDSSNMFVRRRFPVGNAVQAGTNRLSVLIRSPESAAVEASRSLRYPLPYSEYPVQSPHRNLLRKVQCHAGWDWGPCLMVSGINGHAYLASPRDCRIEYVSTRQRRLDGTRWELQVSAEVYAHADGQTKLAAQLEGPREIALSQSDEFALHAGINHLTVRLPVVDPALWWPAGYGDQSLYELKIQAGDDSAAKRIGFRELETVVRDDARGRSLTFRINGRDIFCKGANWIPVDALPARQSDAAYRARLESARDANMNMLRVWGGGQYESAEFYDLCDELGLLIWHDFMFACSTYPADPLFLANVSEEVVHQVKRLRDHPSIAIWCGNNENLGALTWFAETRRFRDRYVVDYDRLYEGTIGDLVESVDPTRTYWPSSPSGGRGDYSDNWHDDTKGDMHYWSVWHEGKPFDAYYEVTPRFCSEFGFQSFPSLSTVEGFAPEDQRNLTSPVMEHHQRNERGNTIIIESLSRYFRFPDGLGNLLYMSQVQQAFAIRTAVEYWRSQRPTCAGALYWQLNDNWPVASWSSLEYSGKWKLLHYAAKRFFAPLHVLGFVKDGALEVWICNDSALSHRGECVVSFRNFDGTALRVDRTEAVATPDTSALVRSYPLESLPAPAEQLFVTMEFDNGSGTIANDLFLTYPKLCELRKARVSATIDVEGGIVVGRVTADAPAFFVSLDPGSVGGHFEDNCFLLLPGSQKTLRFVADPAPGENAPAAKRVAEELERALSVHHLSDSYR